MASCHRGSSADMCINAQLGAVHLSAPEDLLLARATERQNECMEPSGRPTGGGLPEVTPITSPAETTPCCIKAFTARLFFVTLVAGLLAEPWLSCAAMALFR
jgi:hypothetical protein